MGKESTKSAVPWYADFRATTDFDQNESAARVLRFVGRGLMRHGGLKNGGNMNEF